MLVLKRGRRRHLSEASVESVPQEDSASAWKKDRTELPEGRDFQTGTTEYRGGLSVQCEAMPHHFPQFLGIKGLARDLQEDILEWVFKTQRIY